MIPPFLLAFYQKRHRKYGYFKVYDSWQAAKEDSTGYTSDTVIEKVLKGASAVKRGEARYERDSVVFTTSDPAWHLLAPLLWIASQNENRLRVLDFGGALGTTYFQHKDFFAHLKELHWDIVEQEKFVTHGKCLFPDAPLSFFSSLEEYHSHPDIVLLSSSLQYLERPCVALKTIVARAPKYLIFDKTPFCAGKKDFITVQKVPKHIYDVSYPSWIFGLDTFMEFLGTHGYRFVEQLSCFHDPQLDLSSINGKMVEWNGYLFKKI